MSHPHVVRTGIFATDEEREECLALATSARNTPVIVLRSGAPSLSAVAWEALKRRVHELALAHGLPDIRGYYGMSPQGEFTKLADTDPDAEPDSW